MRVLSEKHIIEGCKKGESIAMQQLFNLYIKRMKGTVFRYTRSSFDMDDILQEGFIRVFKNIDSYNYQGSFEGWIRRVIINTAINYYNKYSNADMTVNYDNVNESEMEAVEIADSLGVEELQRLIAKMPEGYRFVFNLFAIDGYSHKEIAEMLNISESTSSSQYSRARQYLIRLITQKDMIKNG